MAQRDRKTLKNFFADGALPTSEHYGDLVDSMVTWKDDGFDKSRTEGWRIKSYAQERSLMSFYSGVGETTPDWTIAHGPQDNGTLVFRPGDNHRTPRPEDAGDPIGLSMSANGAVGVRFHEPDWDLDVDGVARMRGRIGFPHPERSRVPANGEWQDATDPIEGCNILEVVAGVGGKKEAGRYALIRAIAMNAYHPRNRFLNWLFERRGIKAQTAVFGSYGDRLRLRWARATEPSAGEKRKGRQEARTYNRPYKLQIKTNSSYGGDYKIRFYVTQLWFDSGMEGSRQESIDRDSAFYRKPGQGPENG